jgi:hypothetical protein
VVFAYRSGLINQRHVSGGPPHERAVDDELGKPLRRKSTS